jgi:putative hydrolase of the HAD superfamily
MIKAVILDFYGVIQTDEVMVWTDRNTAEHPDLPEAVNTISLKIDQDEINMVEYYQLLAEAIGQPVEQVKADLAKIITINHPLLETVDELRKQGIKTAVLSNDGSSLRTYMQEHDITKYFDEIFISGELNMMKPDPRIYKYAAQQLGFEPYEIIFFDDRQSNIDGALQAGLQAERYTSVAQVQKLLS